MRDYPATSQKSLILVGLSGSGKSTLGFLLSGRLGIPLLEVGKYVVLDSKECLECNNPLDHADHVFKSKDYYRFVFKVLQIAKEYPETIIVGPRRTEELAFLKEQLKRTLSVGLKVNQQTRDERRFSRFENQPDEEIRENLRRRDRIELSWGAERAISSCDFTVDGTQDLELSVRFLEDLWYRDDREYVERRVNNDPKGQYLKE